MIRVQSAVVRLSSRSSSSAGLGLSTARFALTWASFSRNRADLAARSSASITEPECVMSGREQTRQGRRCSATVLPAAVSSVRQSSAITRTGALSVASS
eukprot:scaffold31485_cov112-Isochrysis_galbana.AAC.3